MAIVGTVIMTAMLPWYWKTPGSAVDWLLLMSTGCVAGIGHFLVVKAFQRAPASVVSPFNYVQLLGATSLGLVLFDELPDAWTGVGAAMIVGGGLYVIHGAARRDGAAG